MPSLVDRADNLASGATALRSNSSFALGWADYGYEVVPLRPVGKARLAARSAIWGSADPVRIRRWWDRNPGANIGLDVERNGLVVLDLDGPAGDTTLGELLDRAGVVLPATYSERSPGHGGGRHLLFRLGDRGRFPSQLGCVYGRPGLDILTAGVMVASGSVHPDGGRYEAENELVNREELPELPAELYDVLTADARARKPVRTAEETSSAGPVSGLEEMLGDTSDGRRGRMYRVVLGLVRAGWSDDQVVALVLSAPLGLKAYERAPRDPEQYVAEMVDAARRWLGREPVMFDPAGWWQAAHTAGLSSGVLRVADHLLAEADFRGEVRRSLGRIALGAATSNARPALVTLQEYGLVELAYPASPEKGTPAVYRLTHETLIGDTPSLGGMARETLTGDTPTSSRRAPTPHLPLSLCVGVASERFRSHDAWRYAPGSLSETYAVACWLGPEPLTTATLAELTMFGSSTIRRHLARLVEVGLVVKAGRTYRLAEVDVRGVLDRVAEECGTAGAYAAEADRLRARAEDWARHREEVETWGSPAWWEAQVVSLTRVLGDADAARYSVRVYLASRDYAVEVMGEYLAGMPLDRTERRPRRLADYPVDPETGFRLIDFDSMTDEEVEALSDEADEADHVEPQNGRGGPGRHDRTTRTGATSEEDEEALDDLDETLGLLDRLFGEEAA